MRRLPSTLALASWMGFLAVSATMRLAGTSETLLVHADALRQLRLADPSTLFSRLDLTSLLLFGIASMLGCALYLLNEARTDRRYIGEGIGFCALGLVAVMAVAPGTTVFSVDTGSAGFWGLLICSLVAIGFDRLITDEAPDDEEEFRAGMAFIAQAMARQTHLYSGPERPDSKAPMR